MPKPNPCPPPEASQLDGFFTEADILAKRHELEMSQEDKHKTVIANLENKICQLRQRKLNEEAQYEVELQKTAEAVRQAEGKVTAAREQHTQCMQDIRDQYAVERAGFVQQLEDLQRALEKDRQTLFKKQAEIEHMDQQAMNANDRRAIEQNQLAEEISIMQSKLAEAAAAHEEKKRVYKEEADDKLKVFTADKNQLKAQIEEVRASNEKRNREYRIQELELQRTREDQCIQQRLDREEMEVRFGPLLMEKDDLTKRIKFLNEKATRRKEEEMRKAQDIVKYYDEVAFDREANFGREKEEYGRNLMEVEETLRKKEAELIQVRQDHDTQIRDINDRIDKRTKDMEKEILQQNEHQRKQMEQITDRGRHNEIEEEIHDKQVNLMNLEAEQQAEEALLQSKLKSLMEKERNLRDGLNARHLKHSDFITSLENEVSTEQSKASNEQRELEGLKEDLQQKTLEARNSLENGIRHAIGRLNDINKDICDVKRCMKEREESAQDRGENVEKRIGDEMRRLGNLKGDLEEQVPPLQDKHNELKQKMKEDKTRHEAKMDILISEQTGVAAEHAEELKRMKDLLNSTRNEFDEEREHMVDILKETLRSNEELRDRHEKEIFDLNVNLVRALEGESPMAQAQAKLKTFKELQNETKRQSTEYERLTLEYCQQLGATDKEHECELEKLNQELLQLTKAYAQDGIKDPEYRLGQINKLLEKKQQLLKACSKDRPHLLDNFDEAKLKNSELRERISQKKKDLQELMQNRQRDMSEITNQIQEQATSHASKQENVVRKTSEILSCALDEAPKDSAKEVALGEAKSEAIVSCALDETPKGSAKEPAESEKENINEASKK